MTKHSPKVQIEGCDKQTRVNMLSTPKLLYLALWNMATEKPNRCIHIFLFIINLTNFSTSAYCIIFRTLCLRIDKFVSHSAYPNFWNLYKFWNDFSSNHQKKFPEPLLLKHLILSYIYYVYIIITIIWNTLTNVRCIFFSRCDLW